MADEWSPEEIDLILADYFAMLADELAGSPYNKAAHNRDLRSRISRSRGSIEFKHQNVSAVLLGLGQPWIGGYKPAANFQKALVDGVLRWLETKASWLSPDDKATYEHANSVLDGRPLWIGPPPTHRNEPPVVDAAFMAAMSKKYDVAQRDERNRALGKAGERIVLESERLSLRLAGRRELAEKVRWTANEDGDGYGYDIHSFAEDGSDRLIEVKTTNGWERTPFHITRNELQVADDCRDSWQLIRIWDFARKPKAFALYPPLQQHAELTATSFLARLR